MSESDDTRPVPYWKDPRAELMSDTELDAVDQDDDGDDGAADGGAGF